MDKYKAKLGSKEKEILMDAEELSKFGEDTPTALPRIGEYEVAGFSERRRGQKMDTRN